MTKVQEHELPPPSSLELIPVDGALPPFDERVLACLQFGEKAGGRSEEPRIAPVHLTVASGRDGLCGEVWRSALPVRAGMADGIRYAENGEILFAWLHLPEPRLADVEQASHDAHLRLLVFMQQQGFPFWLRAWNYLSAINEGEGDRERYRQFTAGRHRSLAGVFGTERFERLLPAATAIGTPSGTGLTVALFAGRTPGIQVENPRQVSAFQYPRIYGPRSPSFSRATLHRCKDRSVLFVSGTASIVGHATMHPGDAAAQFEETLRNLQALLDHAALEHFPGQGAQVFRPRAFKLYVRDALALQSIGDRWRTQLGGGTPTAVLMGDICRSDLLVEVEAVYECPR